MRTAKNSFGEPYNCIELWPDDCFVQCGDSGLVIDGSIQNILESKNPVRGIIEKTSYVTSFFEAFPKEPKCFIRGEGKTILEAEKQAWDRYLKIKDCDHEMERRNRKDGYGYCKKCTYSSMCFEPLNKCCVCNQPTRYTTDKEGSFYCEDHLSSIPEDLLHEYQKS